eukprot:Blabericola_migrator_1__1448@NODE_1381_length_4673_cov_78_048198_g926_i0_p1_GENE_NODE_1381_length_4673_cov_78_048198_g926_i0NODE_1381_length_4673_cov_78_048198_g926_i0_p1_ORF_typecomplete_len508_score67_79Adap_comp_sub/PF00928_21/1_4e35Clat_adaptor_s/PF01217_20/3_1e16_NODE_1381_length_4673_cov_78_048198_g926_i03741897
MIGQLCVLSRNGDTIVIRDFRNRGLKGSCDVLFRRIKSAPCSPIVVMDNLCFIYLKRNGLYFIITIESSVDAPLSLWIDILECFVRVIKDFCGVLSEDCIRKNFTLVYELIDEMFDYGYPQALQTGDLTNVIRNEPAGFDPAGQGYSSAISSSLSAIGSASLQSLSSLTGSQAVTSRGRPSPGGPKTVPSNASQAPISASTGALAGGINSHDIFIDIIDRINLESTTDGQMKSLTADGMILIKSYLTTPVELRLGLNEDLHVSNEFLGMEGGEGSLCQLKDCLFHESVSIEDFASTKSLLFTPPQGEFVFMRYRVAQSMLQRPPFLVYAETQILDKDRFSVTVKLRSEAYHKAFSGMAAMTLDLPSWITTCQTQIHGASQNQMCDFLPNENKINWTNRRITLSTGDCGFVAKMDVDLTAAPKLVAQALLLGSTSGPGGGVGAFPRGLSPKGVLNQYFGPVFVNFELPMFTSSKLQIRFLRLASGGNVVPRRWVRYATQSASFTARFV